MLGLEDVMTIQALEKRGVYLCDIAEQLRVHPKTVSRLREKRKAGLLGRKARAGGRDR